MGRADTGGWKDKGGDLRKLQGTEKRSKSGGVRGPRVTTTARNGDEEGRKKKS